MTIKVKYRVYVTQLCRKCKRVHPQPTNRHIFHQAEGEVDAVIQKGSALANSLLDRENQSDLKASKRSLQRRALYQYYLELDQ